LGIRQVGKSTLLRDRMKIPHYLTFDEQDVKAEAKMSPKAFLARCDGIPTVLDEVQKVPEIFDSLKALVDRKKIPGRWFLSGSVAFSGRIGIRESLTGRIGLLHLFPMSLAEIKQREFAGSQEGPFLQYDRPSSRGSKPRFSVEELTSQMNLGGLPVPAFLRDHRVRSHYWDNWLDTTLSRDAQKSYGTGFDPEYCMALVRMLARALPEGEYPSLDFVTGDKRKAKKYIQALQDIFFLRRFTVHEEGVGKDHWIFGDSGLAFHLAPQKSGPGTLLSLARHMVLNEIFCFNEYQGHSLSNLYFKSARGSVIDLVWDNIPVRIIAEGGASSSLGYYERAMNGAMKTLKAPRGILVAPTNLISIPKKGIAVVPWSYWS
jgi:predicted AAA+ superfamily ATPase